MNIKDIFRILEEGGIKKQPEDDFIAVGLAHREGKGGYLYKVIFTVCDTPLDDETQLHIPDELYETGKNKKGNFLYLMADYKGTAMAIDILEFRLLSKNYKELVKLEYENFILKKVQIDDSLVNELKKPKTKEEEINFIRRVIRIYKKDL